MPLLADSLRKLAPPEDPRIEQLREELRRLMVEGDTVAPDALLQARLAALRRPKLEPGR